VLAERAKRRYWSKMLPLSDAPVLDLTQIITHDAEIAALPNAKAIGTP
jgi:hypothetical protein